MSNVNLTCDPNPTIDKIICRKHAMLLWAAYLYGSNVYFLDKLLTAVIPSLITINSRN